MPCRDSAAFLRPALAASSKPSPDVDEISITLATDIAASLSQVDGQHDRGRRETQTAYEGRVGASVGVRRRPVARSKAAATRTSNGSLHAGPMIDRPTGSPATNPIGSVTFG